MGERVGIPVVLACALLAACAFDTTGVWNFDGSVSEVDARTDVDANALVDAPVGDRDAATDADTPPDADTTPDADNSPDADTTPDAQATGLVDDGLLVRYYLDEAASGQGPEEVHDSAPAPLPLAVTYNPDLSFIEVGGNRGLSWSKTGVDARASVAVDGTKIADGLDGAKKATIELVVDIEAVTNKISRISHIGVNQEAGRFTLASSDPDVLRFHLNDSLAGTWAIDLPAAGRVVLHMVFDSTQADGANRTRLYVDGSLQPLEGDVTPPALDTSITLPPDHHYVLGNREVGGRSFKGEMFYAAMYSTALSAAEVAQNAEILSADDDSP